jgi:hypothetical protein
MSDQPRIVRLATGQITIRRTLDANFDGNTYATDINEAGQVVGNFSLGNRSYGFIYDAENGLRSVNSLLSPDSGWDVQYVVDINDAGQIAAEGVIGINRHAALITPETAPTPALSISSCRRRASAPPTSRASRRRCCAS